MDMDRENKNSSESPTRRRARGSASVAGRSVISPIRYLLAFILGLCVGILGTLVQRSGAAAGIPYGMLMAYLLVALASWWVRNDSGSLGLSLHLVSSTVMVWILSMRGPGGDVLMPYADFPSFFAKYAAFLWMGGLVLIQFIAICLPESWFADKTIKKWSGRIGSQEEEAGQDDSVVQQRAGGEQR